MLKENMTQYTMKGLIVLLIAVVLMLPACSMSDSERLKNEARKAVEESMAEMWTEYEKE